VNENEGNSGKKRDNISDLILGERGGIDSDFWGLGFAKRKEGK
jgi:hypothetical protein